MKQAHVATLKQFGCFSVDPNSNVSSATNSFVSRCSSTLSTWFSAVGNFTPVFALDFENWYCMQRLGQNGHLPELVPGMHVRIGLRTKRCSLLVKNNVIHRFL